MASSPNTPVFHTVTHKCPSKKRFTVLDDAALMELMLSVGRKIEAAPRVADRVQAAGAKEFVGTYALPTNNVLEVHRNDAGVMVGYLFNNFDVWMSYLQPDVPNSGCSQPSASNTR